MIIIDKHNGQLCNRLWSLLPVISFSLEKNIKILVLWSPKDVVSYFTSLAGAKNIHFYYSGIKKFSWWWRINVLLEKTNNYINEPLETFQAKNTKIYFIDAWKHSEDVSYIQNHKQEIKKLFQPNESVIQKISHAFGFFDGLTIGVHIRRGDYKEYLSGRYYLSVEKWAKYIKCLSSQSTNKDVRFLICSNEDGIDKELLKLVPTANIFSIQNTNGITDLYALSKCDYIIGVPSSYSQWASFIGETPLFLITNEKMPLLEDFHKIVYFNHFDNGSSLGFDNERYYLIE